MTPAPFSTPCPPPNINTNPPFGIEPNVYGMVSVESNVIGDVKLE